MIKKVLMCSAAIGMGAVASVANAEQTISIDGTAYPLSALMASCQGIVDDPARQVACFNDLSQLIAMQAANAAPNGTSVPEALEALRAAAVYQDDDTGLVIDGTGCELRIVYYGNYFHVSRRNISEIDVVAASFDASKVEADRTIAAAAAGSTIVQGAMADGATASASGGTALDSSQHGFPPKSPRLTIAQYAAEVAGLLPRREGPAFAFVLVHPKRAGAQDEILAAFETYLGACRAASEAGGPEGDTAQSG